MSSVTSRAQNRVMDQGSSIEPSAWTVVVSPVEGVTRACGWGNRTLTQLPLRSLLLSKGN